MIYSTEPLAHDNYNELYSNVTMVVIVIRGSIRMTLHTDFQDFQMNNNFNNSNAAFLLIFW